MNASCRIFALPILILVSGIAPQTGAAQSKACAGIETLKINAYGFHPEESSSEVRGKKSAQIDAFWDLVQSKGASGKSCLTDLLRAEKDDGYFLFDGAVLLDSLDRTGSALPVIVDAAARASLRDVDAASYIDFAMKLNARGADITRIAKNYLLAPRVEAYVPAQDLRLNRNLGALLLYGSMPASQRDAALIALANSKSDDARYAALRVLSTSLTEEAFRALATIEISADTPELVRRDVEGHRTWVKAESNAAGKYSREEILARLRQITGAGEAPAPIAEDEEFIRSAIAGLAEADLPLEQEARRRSIQGVTEQSIREYLAHTRILLGVVNRLDLFSAYRIH